MSGTLQASIVKDSASATNNLTLDTGGNATVGNTLVMGSSFLRNRIINGNMTIDQRNSGASATQTTSVLYTLDRWAVYGTVASKFTAQQNAGSVTTAAGFPNYLGVTSSSAYSVLAADVFWLAQYIEGFNTADLGWGTASAKTVTLSFVVYSSLTGTFGGALRNSATTRSYPFTYSIPTANTWTTISVTIAGDTSGTWVGATNGIGINLSFGLGVGATSSGTAGAWAAASYVSATGATSVVGTSGATFYITGVQFEVGTVATPFERRQYGQELMLCQRYYQNVGSNVCGNTEGTTSFAFQANFYQQMRIAPSCSVRTGFYFNVRYSATDTNILNPSATFYNADQDGVWGIVTSSGLVTNYPFVGRHANYASSVSSSEFIAASAEL